MVRSLIKGQRLLFTTAIKESSAGNKPVLFIMESTGEEKSLVEAASDFARIAGAPASGGLIYGYNISSIAGAILVIKEEFLLSPTSEQIEKSWRSRETGPTPKSQAPAEAFTR